MILCVATDDHLGMTFHERRQSQDRILRERLLEISGGSRLWINHYTAKQFGTPLPENVKVDEQFLEKAADDDFCFVENLSPADYEKQIKKIYLFKWNRVYPADTYFTIPLGEGGWKLIAEQEFEGHSHKKITMEEWEHENQ